MGLFAQRPEEATTWASLPGEPARPRSRAEVLPEEEPADAVSGGLLGIGETRLSSITIPMSSAVDSPRAPEESEGERTGQVRLDGSQV